MAKENRRIKKLRKQLGALRNFRRDANFFLNVPEVSYKLYDGARASLNEDLEQYTEKFLEDNPGCFKEIEKLKLVFLGGYALKDVIEKIYPIDPEDGGLDFESITFKRFLLEAYEDGSEFDGDMDAKVSKWNALKFNSEFLSYFKENFRLGVARIINENAYGRPLAFALENDSKKTAENLIEEIKKDYLVREDIIKDTLVDLNNGFVFYHNIEYKDIVTEVNKLSKKLGLYDIEELDPEYFKELKKTCVRRTLTYEKIEDSLNHMFKLLIENIKDKPVKTLVDKTVKILESSVKDVPYYVREKFKDFKDDVIDQFEKKFGNLFIKEFRKCENFNSKILFDKPNKKGFLYNLYEHEYHDAIKELHYSDYNTFEESCEKVYNVLVKFQAVLDLCSRSQNKNFKVLEMENLNTDADYTGLKSEVIKSIEDIIGGIQKRYPIKFKNAPIENKTINYNNAGQLLDLCEMLVRPIRYDRYLLEKEVPHFVHSIFYSNSFKFTKDFELMPNDRVRAIAKDIEQKYDVEIDFESNEVRAKEFIWRMKTEQLELDVNGYISDKDAVTLVKELYNIKQNE
jgi:hypothetical protein